MTNYLLDDGIRLNIKLDMPKNFAGKCPLVIVIHGFTGHMEERHITAVSSMLNQIGCASLRVDMYGHGSSGGEFRNHTLYKWISNAVTVIDYAQSLDFVSDIYLLGHSQGGLTVMLVAAIKRDVIKGIVPMSPAIVIPECARSGNVLGVSFDPDHVPQEIGWSWAATISALHRQFMWKKLLPAMRVRFCLFTELRIKPSLYNVQRKPRSNIGMPTSK